MRTRGDAATCSCDHGGRGEARQRARRFCLERGEEKRIEKENVKREGRNETAGDGETKGWFASGYSLVP